MMQMICLLDFSRKILLMIWAKTTFFQAFLDVKMEKEKVFHPDFLCLMMMIFFQKDSEIWEVVALPALAQTLVLEVDLGVFQNQLALAQKQCK